MQTPYLLEGLASGPSVIATILRQFDAADFDMPFDPTRFTVREVVAHLADWEEIWRERAEHGQNQTKVAVLAMDEGERAAEQNYATWDVEKSLDLYRQRRSDFVERVRALSPEEMDRTYLHPAFGPISMWVHCMLLAGHDLYHIQQLLDYQAAARA